MTTAINSETCSAISVLIIFYLLLRIEACAVREVAAIIASCNSLANRYTYESHSGRKIARNLEEGQDPYRAPLKRSARRVVFLPSVANLLVVQESPLSGP